MIPVLIYSGLVGGAILRKFIGNRKFDPSIHQYPNKLSVKEAVKLINNNYFDYILDVRTKKNLIKEIWKNQF